MQTMSSLKLIAKLSTYLPGKIITNKGALTILSTKGFVTAPTRYLQFKKEDDEVDTCEKTKEAADAVKDGAKEVRHTCEFVRDTVKNTATAMNKMAKETTEKVTETAETLTDKTKGTVSGAWGVAKNTAEIIKDKVMDKCLEEGAEEFLLKPLQFSDLKKLQPYLLKSLHHYSSIDSIDNSDDNNVTVKEEVGGGENDQTNQTKSATEINHARGTVNNNIVGISRRKAQTIPERSRPTMEGLRDQGPRWRD